MIVLYALLVTLPVYSLFGTLLFALVEKLKIPIRLKVAVMTFGHPLLAGLFLWFICSIFNKEIAETTLVCLAGTLLRVPFSDRKYLTSYINESGEVTIGYISELLWSKKVLLRASGIKDFVLSDGTRLIDKPSQLTIVSSVETLKFTLLDNKIKPSL